MMMPALAAGRRELKEELPVIDTTLDKYVQDKAVFACPADRAGHASRTGTSYFWNVALNNQPLASLNFLNLSQSHSQIPILSDKEGFHPYVENKVNILYADGHATKDLKFYTETDAK
jgi:prepilin-type processing-associated H-X9-DG protein